MTMLIAYAYYTNQFYLREKLLYMIVKSETQISGLQKISKIDFNFYIFHLVN